MSAALIHPTAVIASTSRVGKDTSVGPFAVIEEDTQIGNDCSIGTHACIKRFTSLGPHNQILEGAVLGGTPQDLKYRTVRSYLRIGSGNVFREGVTIHRGTGSEEATVLGDENYLMAYSHVAHNCTLGNQVILSNNVALAGHVQVGSNAFLSGGVVVHQFCRIGRCAMLGGNAKVVQDVPPFFLADGVPARVRSLNQVGLRRSGFSAAEVSVLKQCHRILRALGQKWAEKLKRLAEIDSALARELVEFAENSQRGWCRFGRD